LKASNLILNHRATVSLHHRRDLRALIRELYAYWPAAGSFALFRDHGDPAAGNGALFNEVHSLTVCYRR